MRYLEFLSLYDAKGNNDSKFDYDPFYSNTSHSDIVHKILGIEQNESLTRSPSILLNKKMRKDHDPNVIEEEMDVLTPTGELDNLKNLLQQEDLRGENRKKNLRHKMRKIKSTSKILISKKMNALKPIRSLSSDQDDASMHESQSEAALYKTASTSLRSSAAEIGANIMKKVTRVKPKYTRSSSEGVGMAALLVRTMMTAPSLDSIAENSDPTHAPAHTSKPISRMGLGDTGSLISLPTKKSHHGHHVENKLNISVGDSIIDLKASDSNLSSNLSMSSATVSEISTEEEEEEEEEDFSEVADGGVVMIDADTISM